MISSPKNRVQEIKSKFENLNCENVRTRIETHLCKQKNVFSTNCGKENNENIDYELSYNKDNIENESEASDEWSPKPNSSYLYNKSDVKRSVSDTKNSLSRQSSDPGKKLHRSHAFRCDRSQKMSNSPKRHGSCNGRSETIDFSLKFERKLSKDRLKKLGNFLEEQMRKENFVPQVDYVEVVGQANDMEGQCDSVPDSEVPQHILDQYATVVKPKRKENDKQEAMTDSGVSSETENVEEDKTGRIKRLMSQFEKPENPLVTNLQAMDELCDSSETIRLERKNPHLKLTDTLKKALKQPLPPGPPPKKPPRIFNAPTIPENVDQQKKEAKRMLEKLEQVLIKREGTETPKKPKEIHYLCTEILDITNRTLLPNQSSDPISRCLNSLNCAITNNSTSSLPYTRLKSDGNSVNMCCAVSNDNINAQQSNGKCLRCLNNEEKDDRFKCHLSCKCSVKNSEFYVEHEHIYDLPCTDDGDTKVVRRNPYGTLNSLKSSRSLEDLRMKNTEVSLSFNLLIFYFQDLI